MGESDKHHNNVNKKCFLPKLKIEFKNLFRVLACDKGYRQ